MAASRARHHVLTHGPWAGVPGLRHGFLDRRHQGGASGWMVAVEEADAPRPVTTPRQVHGTRIVTCDPAGGRPEADGLATATPGQLVGITTADCAPVLLVDAGRRTAAAVHAGWRGAAGGVLEVAVSHLGTAFGSKPEDLEAVIGPAVGACCYEVGPEVPAAFEARTGSVTVAAMGIRAGLRYLDLRDAARLLLLAAGVRTVSVLGPCTACGTGYHSFRRDREGAGRQLSFIGWGSTAATPATAGSSTRAGSSR